MSRSHTALLLLVAASLIVTPAATAQEFFGTYSGDGERFDGSYLGFAVAGDGVADISCRDNVLVDDLGVDVTDVSADGATVVASGPNATVTLHDTPTCHVRIDASADVTIKATGADPVDVREAGDGLELKRGVVASLWSSDASVAADDGVVTLDLEDGDSAMLRVRPGDGSFPAMSASPIESEISQAIEGGSVGAEAFVQGGPRAGHAVSVFADLDVAIEQGDAVNVTVAADEADVPNGKVVVTRVDDLALGDDGDVQVRYDGEAIPAADDLADVVDPHDDGIDAEHHVVSLDNSHVVLVSVPHFSTHTITIDKVAQFVRENPEVAALTVVGAVAVVGLAVGGMFKPRGR